MVLAGDPLVCWDGGDPAGIAGVVLGFPRSCWDLMVLM